MKRTLKDTERKVRIVIDNYTIPVEINFEDQRWSAGVSIDGEILGHEVSGTTAHDVLSKLRVALEAGDRLNDPVMPVPEKDYELLCSLLRNIASTWGDPRDVPDWRENEYIRGQLELVTETCRVLTDEEWERGDVDMDTMRDRITTWIEAEVWK
jgi:hypothetical protein